ncbi:MAG: metallophosphoesterase [Burkholderiales bacterium]
MKFALAVTALLGAGYAYLATRLATGTLGAALLLVPFLCIWIVPVMYWGTGRPREGLGARLLHRASYLSMAWVSFALVLTIARDALLIATWGPAPLASAHAWITAAGVPVVLGGSLVALALGAAAAFRGPRVQSVDVPIERLHPDLEGFRIVQVSDLHVGPNIGRRYVQRVVDQARALKPDLIALTGDIVDGPVERLASDVAPLGELAREGKAYFVLGNHDCYAGADVWLAHFRSLGMRVLLNAHELVRHGAARLLIGGLVDPAYRHVAPQISLQDAPAADVRVLLAHNPQLAPIGARAGFDVQLSGHTHAGQFFPWTLAIRLVHAPHVAGLSREGSMTVYVSAGTGTWGPPVRFGTTPELTLLRLVRA